MTTSRMRVPRGSRRPRHPDTGTSIATAWTGGPARAAQASFSLLWLALVAGPIALLLVGVQVAGTGRGQVAPSSQSVVVPEEDRTRDMVGDVAVQWVNAWLTTPGDRVGELRRWWSGPVELPNQPEALDTELVAATRVETGVWEAIVAASSSDGRRYFQVPVLEQEGRLLIAGLPVPTGSPTAGDGSSQVGYPDSIPVETALGQAVAGFTTSYLTGAPAEDLARWISPRSTVRPVVPAPASSVTLSDVRLAGDPDIATQPSPATGSTVRVLATVRTQQPDGVDTRSFVLPLTVVSRDGRWEVDRIDSVPALRQPASTAATSPATAHPPSPPTQGAP